MAKFVLNQPVSPAPVDSFDIEKVKDFDDKNRTMILLIKCWSGVDLFPTRLELTITNGWCNTLEINPHPTFQDIFLVGKKTAEDDPRLANGFDLLVMAFAESLDSDDILPKMYELGLIPAGAPALF